MQDKYTRVSFYNPAFLHPKKKPETMTPKQLLEFHKGKLASAFEKRQKVDELEPVYALVSAAKGEVKHLDAKDSDRMMSGYASLLIDQTVKRDKLSGFNSEQVEVHISSKEDELKASLAKKTISEQLEVVKRKSESEFYKVRDIYDAGVAFADSKTDDPVDAKKLTGDIFAKTMDAWVKGKDLPSVKQIGGSGQGGSGQGGNGKEGSER